MTQEKALDALAPFVALSKSANTPRYAADLVGRAISHPDTYVFAELLYKPQIQALATADPQYAVYLTLLQIFSYGTYDDYKRGAAPSTQPKEQPQASIDPAATASSSKSTTTTTTTSSSSSSSTTLPPLDDAQTSKLRQLSLLSLAKDRASLGYDHLERALHLQAAASPDTTNSSTTDTADDTADADAALETLVLAAVYAGLLQATLDPARRVVRISSVAPLRDPAPGAAALATLHDALQAWSARCEDTLAGLDAQVAGIRQAAAARAADARQRNARFERAVEAERRVLRGRNWRLW